jgi:hypothetical protein
MSRFTYSLVILGSLAAGFCFAGCTIDVDEPATPSRVDVDADPPRDVDVDVDVKKNP